MRKIKFKLSHLQLQELNNYFLEVGDLEHMIPNKHPDNELSDLAYRLFKESAMLCWKSIHKKAATKVINHTKNLSLNESEARVFHFFTQLNQRHSESNLQGITINMINRQIHQEVIV